MVLARRIQLLFLSFSVILFVAAPAIKLSALGNNLINNPSLEIVGTKKLPKDWYTSRTGTNSSTFQYMNEGYSGNRSIKTTISKYTNGDAKWYFSPVSVIPNNEYTFNTYYKSSVTTDIIIQTKNANGVALTSWLKTVPAATNWTLASATTTVPADAVSATIQHTINKVGYLQTDDMFFGLTTDTPSNPVPPTVVITSPANNTTISGTQTISADAVSTGATVAGVQFKVDGTNIGSEDTVAPYQVSWDTTTATNAIHALTAVVRSANGLSATSTNISVQVNNAGTPPVVDEENLIINPSMETVDPTNNLKPYAWLSNKWGTNTTGFTYDTAGARTGSRSVTTKLTSIVDGDAKWYFEPVIIQANKTYLYRDYFKSSVPTRVVLASIDANGTYSYKELATAPASAGWAQYQNTFVIPSNATKATVFHLIDQVGSLTIDDAYMQIANPGTSDPLTDIVVPNGSVENGTTSPTNWQSSSWGTNTPNFQYITNDGHTGSRSVKVTVSNYASGDAKWFFDPIKTLTPGKQYRFNAWYKTNIIPHPVAMFIRADGTEQYFGMPAAQPNGSTNWQQYSDTFSVPMDAVSVSVFMYANQNGWIQSDDYSITEYKPTGFSRPLLTMTFDDGHEDNVNTALPLLNQYGFKSTQCYATTFIEGNTKAVNDILKFKNSGHEICSHSVTHPFLTTLNATSLNYELQHSKQYLESITGQPVLNFASPYGDYNATVNTAIKSYYQSHRTVDEGYNSKDNFDPYRLRVQNVLDTTSANQIKIWIAQAKVDNTWLILVYHRIANNPGPYDSYTNVFSQHLATINTSGIAVRTYQDAFTEVRAQQ